MAGCVHLRRWLASSLAMEGLLLLQAVNKLRLSTLLSASEEERKHWGTASNVFIFLTSGLFTEMKHIGINDFKGSFVFRQTHWNINQRSVGDEDCKFPKKSSCQQCVRDHWRFTASDMIWWHVFIAAGSWIYRCFQRADVGLWKLRWPSGDSEGKIRSVRRREWRRWVSDKRLGLTSDRKHVSILFPQSFWNSAKMYLKKKGKKETRCHFPAHLFYFCTLSLGESVQRPSNYIPLPRPHAPSIPPFSPLN